MLAKRHRIIQLTKAEVQSGVDRQRFAELLIQQLPSTHGGRNTWLLNYGVSEEAQAIRDRHSHKPIFVERYRAAETRSS